ncbi:MAG: hypothetical protein KIT09_07900 [Bryobacteraceae bacterium]|nr:hypothetical protein [Bryobacteraceae bacterium]
MNNRPSRRRFLVSAAGAGLLAPLYARIGASGIRPAGPGAKYQPRVKAAFVRRQGDYGMLWPGQIYDGQTALLNYRRQLQAAAGELGMRIDIRSEPVCSEAEAEAWIAGAIAEKADGLFVALLDRQEHAWPTAAKAAASGVPTIVFAPIGAAFTTNTAPLARRSGLFIASTDDFRQAAFGLKMIKAGARLREMRFIVLAGAERRDDRLADTGTRLRYVPAATFLEEYERTPVSEEVRAMAARYIGGATAIHGPGEEDVIKGVKSYMVARSILEREEGDGITMDCLGALGHTKVSLPCISWSSMLDDGIPAACEADLGAAVTHALVQYLFDRPGFQQDPVPETARNCLLGAHCTCPTRLRGWSQPPEPYFLSYHHGKRDAVPVPRWSIGERVTVADLLLRQEGAPKPRMVISTGSVVDNVSVPPAGGCVVSVMVELDGRPELLDYPGFHQIFFYGDCKSELKAYCRLYGIEPVIA